MRIEIYEGKGGVFGLCEDPTLLPSAHRPWKPFKSIDAQPGEQRIGADIDKVIADIEKQGYHLTKPKITTTISTSSQP